MTLHDEKPYRPKVRGRRVHGRDELSFRRLTDEVRSAMRSRARTSPRARVAVKSPARLARRVVVKAWYVRVDGGAQAAKSCKLFLRYMEKEDPELDASHGVLYGARDGGLANESQSSGVAGAVSLSAEDRDALRADDAQADPRGALGEREETPLERELLEPLPGEKHQFRLVISPEDARQLDLTTLVKELMRQVEKDVGQPLIWAAANHYDTDDPHTHVVIRGVDRNGKEVRFDRAYIQRIWRERTEELVTRELGPRTEIEYRRQLEREVHQGRLTSLDRAIGKRAVDGVVRLRELDKYQRERLKVLGDMGLARERNLLEWQLSEGWQQKLREDGERGDIIKQMHKAMRLDTSRYRIVDRARGLPRDPAEAGEITGRVVALGLIDSTPGAMYAVVETTRGAGYYVPLSRAESGNVRRGDLVTLYQQRSSWSKPIDVAVDAVARESGGAVRGESFRAALERRLLQLKAAGEAVEGPDRRWTVRRGFRRRLGAADVLDAYLEHEGGGGRGVDLAGSVGSLSRRLRELEAVGLVNRQGDAYRVTPGLLSELARRDRDEPAARVGLRQQRLRLDAQVEYLGPTWLDQAAPRGASEFAAAVSAAQARRRAFLKGHGIELKDLERRERERVAFQHAHRLQRAVAKRADGFRGVVESIYEAGSGNRYAIVVGDGQVLALRAGRRVREFVGREVEVAFVRSEYDGKSKLEITLAKLGRDRGPTL